MKSHIDINQSKKLIEILPLESADMTWEQVTNSLTKDFTWKPTMGLDSAIKYNLFSYRNGYVLPCWSLAALLDVLEGEIYDEDGNTYELNVEKDGTFWYICYKELYNESKDIETNSTEELIDACYEIILKLKELNLL